MKYYAVCLYDSAAQVHLPPQFVPNLGSAIRGFGDACRKTDANSDIARHPEDFTLMHLGSFEDEEGRFEFFDKPRQIARGLDYVQTPSTG